ncbi:MAG: GNAT family N-acetyltransferase [Armatimonadetes bacterium]|nr:GNAT family N-acetyltransferase [Armatimonadota bacterium]NIM24851.1 GNAT family N-acetyltransferase [Armatimonadota bacterium]NIM68741.1 GNAT family N-acetyltransferase [Armatimonadota bacterium]NIM76034.1 GNAT family N-acetyltransferase [Armatimonadota bacterium]NIN06938.1 GNAT family N-acetyltransferase [Armatimonadota bacterium]
MEILQFQPDMADGLARCYSDIVSHVPHCQAVTAETFSSMEQLATPACREEALLAASEKGEVAGFVHVGIALPPSKEWDLQNEPGVIRFLSYRPGERRIGEALLQAAEKWARERSRTAIAAWYWNYRYPFYHLPHALLSDRLGHIHSLFGMAGYAAKEGEVFFEWQDFNPPAPVKPPLEFQLQIEWQEQVEHDPHEYGRGGVVVKAIHKGKWLGQCNILHMNDKSSCSKAPEWSFCDNLAVEQPIQGKGVGRFLLATALTEMRDAGCRHTAISTNATNHRAYLFYTNFGYRFLDRTFWFHKELQQASQP